MTNTVTVSTIPHAAHCAVSRGKVVAYDNLQVDSIQDRPFPLPAEAKAISAEYHCGYRVGDVQHFLYIKQVKAPKGSTCKNCR